MSASNSLVRILETNRLIRLNFKDWLWNLKIILSFEKIGYVLDQDLIPLPIHPTTDQRVSHEKWLDNDNKVRCFVLVLVSNKLQCQHKDMKTTKEILAHLQELYGEQSHVAYYEVSKRLFKEKMYDG